MSASPTPPAKASKWTSRMGGAMRRASTVLTMANVMTPPRSNTPASSSEGDNAGDTASIRRGSSDNVSLRRSTSKSSLAQSMFGGLAKNTDVHAPSPIAESPAKEWEATRGDDDANKATTSGGVGEGAGPSPLANTSTPAVEPIPEPTPAPEPVVSETREMDTTAPQTVDSSAGNFGAFKDSLDDDLPTGGPISDPFASPPPAPQVVEEETPQPQLRIATPPPAMETSNSYFDKPMAESMRGVSTDDLHQPELAEPVPIIPPAFARAVDSNSIAPVVSEPTYVSPPPSIPVSRAPSVAPLEIPVSRAPSNQPPPPPQQVELEPIPVSAPISRVPSIQPTIPTVPVTREPSQAASITPMPVPVPFSEPTIDAEQVESFPNPHPQFMFTPATPAVARPPSDPIAPVPAVPVPAAPPPSVPAPSVPSPAVVSEPEAPPPPAPPAPVYDPYHNPFADYETPGIWGGAITNPGFERGGPVAPTQQVDPPAPVVVEQKRQAATAKEEPKEETKPSTQEEPKPAKEETHMDPWGELPVSSAIAMAVPVVVGMDRAMNASKESRRSVNGNGNMNGKKDDGAVTLAAVPVSREVSQKPQERGLYGIGVVNVSREQSVRMPNPHDSGIAPALTTGFADEYYHPGPIPGQEQPHVVQDMPIPMTSPDMKPTVIDNKSAVEDHHTIFMPLPPFQEVTSGKYNLAMEEPTTERTPLLTKEPEDTKHHSSIQLPIPIPIPSYAPTINNVNISPLAGTSSQPHPSQTYTHNHQYSTTMSNIAAETHARILTSQLQPRLHSLGWLEYHLPDGMFYYVHPTRKLVTDLNLRRDGVLDRISGWMDEEERVGESVGVFVEGWVVERVTTADVSARSGTKDKKGKKTTRNVERDPRTMVLERYWVDHHARSVIRDEEVMFAPGRGNGYGNGNGNGSYNYGYGAVTRGGAAAKGKRQSTMNGAMSGTRRSDDDQLDMEYRYWTFMEAHPAHTALSPRAKSEAMDVLTWAWTDRLLPSHRSIPPPFNQEECNELSTLLRSFGSDKSDENGIETRIISRILIRVALWRQTYFRPTKPLPLDTHLSAANGMIGQPQDRSGSSQFIQTIAAYLMLGIPYFFVDSNTGSTHSGQARSTPGDEAQMMRNPRSNPMLIVGGVSCIFAAIILSTSVTFLSIPSIAYFTRMSILVSLALATLSLATTGIAILRQKSEMEDSSSSSSSMPMPMTGGVNRERQIITARTLILSAPLVFLSYSIIAFVVAIISHILPTLSIWLFYVVQFVW